MKEFSFKCGTSKYKKCGGKNAKEKI